MDKPDTVQIVRDLYAAFARNDIQTALNTFANNVEFQHPMTTAVWPWAGKLHGREQVARFFAGLAEAAEWEHFEPREFIAQDDRVVVTVYERLRLRSNGRPLENEMVNLFTLQNGKIVRMRIYEDTAPLIVAIRNE